MRKKQIIVAIPMSHTWFWPQTCLAKLTKYKTGMENTETEVVVIFVDNAWLWSPARKGIKKMIGSTKNASAYCYVFKNLKHSKWHGTALDYIVDEFNEFDVDYLFAMETDVLICSDGWLKWYLDKMSEGVFAVGHWHGEQFINPSATLYDMKILREANKEFQANKDPNMYWGKNFEKSESIIPHYGKFLEDVGPFSEKRGWPPGTKLKFQPTGQLRGPGWYEPGQQFHHWAVEKGYTYVVTPCRHEVHPEHLVPVGTFYGSNGYQPYLVHLWGGTRALDLLKHPVEDPTVLNNMGWWLKREATYWKAVVPLKIQRETLAMIKEYGWYSKDKKELTEREKKAVETIEGYYREGGIDFL